MRMKISIWGLGLLMLIGSRVFAQGAAASAVAAPSLGVEAGINLANLNGQNVNDVIGSRLGFVGGGYVNLPLTAGLAFQPEVLYEQKGGKINGNAYQLDYIEVPVLLDITFGVPVLNPGILLGPTFDANVFNSGLSNLNSADVGLMGGVQVNLAQFLVSGTYEVGLTDVSSSQKVQNGTFTFLVGLSFL